MELNKLEKTTLLASLMLLTITITMASNVIYINLNNNQLQEKNLKVCLQLDVYDSEGNLRESRTKEDDLVLNNFGVLFSSILKDVTGVYTKSFVKTTGGAATVYIRYAEIMGFWEGIADTDCGQIGIGTGTTTPTVSDYNLETQVEGWTDAGDPAYSNGNITMSASISISENNEITEAAFMMEDGQNTALVVMFHDTFNAVSVTNGDSLVATYTLVLAEEFTDNFGRLFAGLLGGIDNEESSKTVWVIDVDSNNVTVITRSGETTEPMHYALDMALDVPVCGIKIGTGTTAVDRTDIDIETQVESIASVGSSSYYGGNVTMSSVFIASASRAVTEAGLFLEVRDNGGTSRQILLWRDVFSAENIVDGEAITITFDIRS